MTEKEKLEKLKQHMIDIEQYRHDRNTTYLNALLEEYKKTQTRIDEHVASFIQRYSEDGYIDLVMIYYILSIPEKRKLKYSLEEIIDRGLDDETVSEIQENLNKLDLSRIKGLQLQIKAELKSLNQKINETLHDHYFDSYVGTFNKTHYAFFDSLGIAKDPSLFDVTKAIVETTLKSTYRETGQSYEDVLKYYNDDLIEKINKEVLAAIGGGDTYTNIIERLAKLTGMDYKRAERLIRTDSSYIGTEAQKELYGEMDVDTVLFVATLDERTSEMCRDMDGTLIPIDEVEPGFNAPPLHYYCRSVLAPAGTDELARRAARDPETGKTYYTDKYMTYKEWKESFELDF